MIATLLSFIGVILELRFKFKLIGFIDNVITKYIF